MGTRKLFTKKELRYFTKNPESISLILGISSIILGYLKYGLYNGILLYVIGFLLLIIYGLFLYKKIMMKALLNKNRKIAIKKLNFDKVDKLKPFEFEQFVGAKFNEYGYKAIVTKASGDFGADVIATVNGKKIAIQVKHYSEENSVGNKAVMEALGGQKHYKTDEAWVISSKDNFTRQAYLQAESGNVKLLTLGDFAIFLSKIEKK